MNKTEKAMLEAIKKKLPNYTETDLKKLKKISTFKEDYEVYAQQIGDLTIMCRVKPNGEVIVKKQSW